MQPIDFVKFQDCIEHAATRWFLNMATTSGLVVEVNLALSQLTQDRLGKQPLMSEISFRRLLLGNDVSRGDFVRLCSSRAIFDIYERATPLPEVPASYVGFVGQRTNDAPAIWYTTHTGDPQAWPKNFAAAIESLLQHLWTYLEKQPAVDHAWYTAPRLLFTDRGPLVEACLYLHARKKVPDRKSVV